MVRSTPYVSRRPSSIAPLFPIRHLLRHILGPLHEYVCVARVSLFSILHPSSPLSQSSTASINLTRIVSSKPGKSMHPAQFARNCPQEQCTTLISSLSWTQSFQIVQNPTTLKSLMKILHPFKHKVLQLVEAGVGYCRCPIWVLSTTLTKIWTKTTLWRRLVMLPEEDSPGHVLHVPLGIQLGIHAVPLFRHRQWRQSRRNLVNWGALFEPHVHMKPVTRSRTWSCEFPLSPVCLLPEP